jgi:hypothetical protein
VNGLLPCEIGRPRCVLASNYRVWRGLNFGGSQMADIAASEPSASLASRCRAKTSSVC